jgi:hypothetical protein
MRNIADKIIDIVAFGLGTIATMAVLTACPDDKSSEETGPASSAGETGTQAAGETGAEVPPPAPAERPESMPLLCSLDNGKWCHECPQGSAGPLCCAGETCVPWDAAGLGCDGVVAWCNNYTLAEGPKATVATCVD